MEQRLADYWRILLDNKELVNAYYERHALLRSEDMVPIAGMLVGLATIEFNLYLRGDELDRMPDTIDWAKFLGAGASPVVPPVAAAAAAAAAEDRPRSRTGSMAAPSAGAATSAPASDEALERLQQRLNAAMDQRAFVEEMKRKTEAKLHETSDKLDQAVAALRTSEEQLGTRCTLRVNHAADAARAQPPRRSALQRWSARCRPRRQTCSRLALRTSATSTSSTRRLKANEPSSARPRYRAWRSSRHDMRLTMRT